MSDLISQSSITYLNRVLQTIRNINQSLVRETEPSHLLQGICDILTKDQGFEGALIIRCDDEGNFIEAYNSNPGHDFLELQTDIEEGRIPGCITAAHIGSVIHSKKPGEGKCPQCPLSVKCSGRIVLSCPIRYEDHLFGLLSAIIPKSVTLEEEYKELFREICEDIAYGLHTIGMREEKEQWTNALKNSEERYRNLFEESPMGIFLIDMEGRIIDANPTIEKILSYSTEELKDMNITAFYTKNTLLAENDMIRLLESRELKRFETELTRKNGEVFYAEITASIFEYGNTILVQGTLHDITEKKRAKEALIREKNLFENTFESLSDAAFIISAKPAIIRQANCRAVEIFGYSKEEMIGQKTDFLHVDSKLLEEFRQHIYPCIKRGEKTPRFKFMMKKKDGTIFPTEHSIAPLFSPDDEFTGMVSIVRDITAEKEAEERERIALDQITENMMQLATLNDEIRNPLTVMRGIIELGNEERYKTTLDQQIDVIDNIVTLLDKRWLDSKKIWDYMRKHDGIIRADEGKEGDSI